MGNRSSAETAKRPKASPEHRSSSACRRDDIAGKAESFVDSFLGPTGVDPIWGRRGNEILSPGLGKLCRTGVSETVASYIHTTPRLIGGVVVAGKGGGGRGGGGGGRGEVEGAVERE